MEDEMDRYVSTSLKNWTATHPASKQLRERLLKVAVKPAVRWEEPVYFHTREVAHEFSHNRLMNYCTGVWFRESLTMSLSWPNQLASLVQVTA